MNPSIPHFPTLRSGRSGHGSSNGLHVKSKFLAIKSIAVIVSVSAASFIAVWALWSFRTRTDTVSVTAIDEGYVIEITSAGRSLLPLGPEGPFQKWNEQTRFLAQGSGEREEIDGLTYKKYTMGKNLETTGLYKMFSCIIYISEEAKRLVVQGELTVDRKYLINHSGTYDGITIDRPNILPLSAHAKIEDIDHRYVRAKGHLKDRQFETTGKIFDVDVWKDGEFEVVGFVYKMQEDPPILHVSSYKRILAE
ncbi:MAG: hypothetical protein WCJ35_28970 [Planctomycetota bacterium]